MPLNIQQRGRRALSTFGAISILSGAMLGGALVVTRGVSAQSAATACGARPAFTLSADAQQAGTPARKRHKHHHTRAGRAAGSARQQAGRDTARHGTSPGTTARRAASPRVSHAASSSSAQPSSPPSASAPATKTPRSVRSASTSPKATSSASTAPRATPSTSKTATPTPSPSPSKTPTPSPSKTPRPSPTVSSPATPAPGKSPGATPTPTPTPSKKPSPSPSPSPSKTAQPKPRLCVAVQSFASKSRITPGHTATFAIWIWSVQARSTHVAVTARTALARGVGKARFTVCPDRVRSVCRLGSLPVGQSDELQVSVKVGKSAALGEHVRLTGRATAHGSFTGHAARTVVVAAPAKHGNGPGPSPSTSPPGNGSLPPLPPVTLPPPPLQPLPGTSSLPGDPAGLFPTVSPDPAASPAPSSPSPGVALPGPSRRGPDATTASATLPISSRIIGGQLAGLAVLAGAIAMAIARLSLRSPRPQDGKNSSQ